MHNPAAEIKLKVTNPAPHGQLRWLWFGWLEQRRRFHARPRPSLTGLVVANPGCACSVPARGWTCVLFGRKSTIARTGSNQILAKLCAAP